MKEEGSYRIQNFAANVDNEIRRLKAQVELFWDREFRCLQKFGLRDGMRVLECGCGPGHVIEKLLQSLPGSEVTGVEIDPLLVQKSRENLAVLGGRRGQILEQSIMQMEFEHKSFDFVIARMVLEHLPNPLNAVKEVYRVLKKAGKGVFIDNDFDSSWAPYSQELYPYESFSNDQKNNGIDRMLVRGLDSMKQKIVRSLHILAAKSSLVVICFSHLRPNMLRDDTYPCMYADWSIILAK